MARFLFSAFLVVAVAAVEVACGPSDPRAAILKQRTRWDVTVLSLSQGADGTVDISTRVSGPPTSTLTQLTVRVHLTGADGDLLQQRWHTFDLSDVSRGGPADKMIRLRDVTDDVSGAGIDMLLDPTPEDQARLTELDGIGS